MAALKESIAVAYYFGGPWALAPVSFSIRKISVFITHKRKTCTLTCQTSGQSVRSIGFVE